MVTGSKWRDTSHGFNPPPLEVCISRYCWYSYLFLSIYFLLSKCSEEPVVTLSAKRRRQELLSSALACVQNVLRHCMQTKPDNMLLRKLCFDYPRSKTCSSPLTSVLHVRQDAPEVATVTRTIKLTLKQKNSLPSDVVEKEKNKSSISLCTRLAHGHCFKYYSS